MTSRTASPRRRLHLQGCSNFRDLGGHRADEGRLTHWRRLFRSDGLHALTAPDMKEVGRLRLSTVLDFRTAAEVADQGEARVKATHHHLPIHGALGRPLKAPGGRQASALGERYLAALESSCETVMEALAILTDPSSYPAVLCCSSGVDRTGIMTAVVLALLGVPDEVVVRDYAASRQVVRSRRSRSRTGHPSTAPVAWGDSSDTPVLPEAMVAFLHGLRVGHGGYLGYAQSIDMAGAVPYLRAALVRP